MDRNAMEQVVLEQCRDDFPMLKRTMHGCPLVYLDSAATAHKPACVIDAVDRFYRDQYATVLRAVYELAEEANRLFQQSREAVQRLLNASSPQEIVFTRGATEAINMAAYSFGKAFFEPGDVVLVTEMEHHSNLVPWQMMCEDRGGRLLVAPIDDDGNLLIDEFTKIVEQYRPKIVAVTHVSNVLGTVNPIKLLAEIVHRHGGRILVDGAQAIPHIKIDVRDADVDFYAFSGHKLYGPNGVGVLYGKAELLEAMPPAQGGGGMVDQVTFQATTYNVIPWKFEAGTMMLAEIIGLKEAIDYVLKIGFDRIVDHEKRLLGYALERINAIQGIKILGKPKQRESVISFNAEGIHPLDLGTYLDLKGIAIRTGHHCAQPLLNRLGLKSTARISFGVYNTQSDIDRFIEALETAISVLS